MPLNGPAEIGNFTQRIAERYHLGKRLYRKLQRLLSRMPLNLDFSKYRSALRPVP